MNLTDGQKETLGLLGTMLAVTDKINPVKKLLGDDFLGSLQFQMSEGNTSFGFLVNLFQFIGSYDDMIEWLTKMLVKILPALEISVKGVLLSNLQHMMKSCNVDPRIPAKYRKEPLTTNTGVYVNIGSIDYNDILNISPLTEEGAPYYFGTYTEGAPVKVKKDWKNYSAREKLAFMKSGGKKVSEEPMTIKVKEFVNPYELARAVDFDAFLWFVIHKAYFPIPKIINVTPSQSISSSIEGGTGVEYDKNTKNYNDGVTIFSLGQQIKINGSKSTVPGSTMRASYTVGNKSMNGRVLSMCYESVGGCNEDGEDCSYTSYWAPISDDNYSANWYADPANYYAYNLSHPKSKQPKKDYNRAKPICNVAYLNNNGGINYVGAHRLLISIPPKPFTTFALGFEGDVIPALNRILFNEKGEPDPNGHLSLPNEPGYVLPAAPMLPDEACFYTLRQYLTYKLPPNNENSNWFSLPAVATSYTWTEISSLRAYGLRFFSASIEEVSRLKEPTEMNVTAGIILSNDGNPNVSGTVLSELVASMNGTSLSAIYTQNNYSTKELGYVINELKRLKNKFVDDSSSLSDKNGSDNPGNGVVEYYVGSNKLGDGCKLKVNILTGKYELTADNRNTISAHLQECYPGFTVYEFNYDLIMGMKMFDAKVLATSLVSSLFNLNIGASMSYSSRERDEAAEEIRQIITEVLDNDEETELTDCFYTFSNEKYSELLHKTELQYLSRKPLNNPDNSVIYIDTEKLMSILDEYDEAGTLQEQSEVISRFFRQASVELQDENMTDTDISKAKFSFATDLIGSLASILIQAVLTPKVMLVYQVNRQMVGGDILEFSNMKDFIKGMKNLVVAIVREIRDIIIRELLAYLMKILQNIISMFAIELAKEQIEVYKNLLLYLVKNCIPKISFGGSRKLLDTTLPEVNYADILGSAGSAINGGEYNYNPSGSVPITPENC